MECRYCRALNAEDDHRCQRCGRRLRMTPVYTGQSAAAPQLDYETPAPAIQSRLEPVSVGEKSAAGEPSKSRLQVVAYQPTLFGSRDMPFDLLSASQPDQKGEILEARSSNPRARARKTLSSGQQSLEFAAETPAHSAEPVIYCDAPVAIAAHRLMAALCDAAIVLVGVALFAGSFFVVTSTFGEGGELAINKQTLPLLGGITVLFALLYNTLWAFGNEDTVGMVWARLRLVNFDGQKPNREQRLYRMAAGALSLMAAGLGLLWALVDEESLTWHDHMSRTFPTPY